MCNFWEEFLCFLNDKSIGAGEEHYSPTISQSIFCLHSQGSVIPDAVLVQFKKREELKTPIISLEKRLDRWMHFLQEKISKSFDIENRHSILYSKNGNWSVIYFYAYGKSFFSSFSI